MKMTRREFLKGSLILGGSLLVPATGHDAKTNSEIPWFPAYGKLEQNGELAKRVAEAHSILEECELCPRRCGVNRLAGERGFCRTPEKLVVYAAHPHFGEERSLVGKHGSGTIFFSNCNLRCVFCQNWPIALEGQGKRISDGQLADYMLHLQKIGCHNINLVTPTHVIPHILNATRLAYQKGLRIPLVYNSSGYERAQILKLLDGVVDIYLPDMKFMNGQQAAKYSSGATDYPPETQNAVREMHRQVGQHQTNSQGVAVRGLMIRHLVMPNRVAGTEQFVKWVANNLPKTTYVNIMHQYHVAYKAFEYPDIWRSITIQEYLEAMQWADEYGLTHLDPNSVKVRNFLAKHQSAE